MRGSRLCGRCWVADAAAVAVVGERSTMQWAMVLRLLLAVVAVAAAAVWRSQPRARTALAPGRRAIER